MFLIRSLHLKKLLTGEKKIQFNESKNDLKINETQSENKIYSTSETIDQLKNIEQEEKIIIAPEVKNKKENNEIKSFEELVQICEVKKEIKIKYELENNLSLVSFKDQKIEISFNSNLDKTFVKELSEKLLEWTNKRWFISFSKQNGLPTLKETKKNLNEEIIKKESTTELSKKVKNLFPDALLVKVEEEK